MNHQFFIHRCLELAGHGRGLVGNGALVGSVLVRDGKVIAEAFHSAYGKPHAERELLQSFETSAMRTPQDDKGSITKDDIILYVNLEPCCHQGKTPPCTDIIIEKGVKTVVFGMFDPDRRVAGEGVQTLRDAGITVIGPIASPTCRRLNRGFVSVRENNRPWITLKKAQTCDGRVSQEGERLMITSESQNKWAHAQLRAKHDAILVGVGTVLADDPLLTVRSKNTNTEFVQPWRIILDPHGKIPHDAKVLGERSIVVVSDQLPTPNSQSPTGKILRVPLRGESFDLDTLFQKLMNPEGDFHGITSILVEGGPTTWEHFHKAGVVDEEVTLVS